MKKAGPAYLFFSFSMKTPAARGQREATALLRGIGVAHEEHL